MSYIDLDSDEGFDVPKRKETPSRKSISLNDSIISWRSMNFDEDENLDWTEQQQKIQSNLEIMSKQNQSLNSKIEMFGNWFSKTHLK